MWKPIVVTFVKIEMSKNQLIFKKKIIWYPTRFSLGQRKNPNQFSQTYVKIEISGSHKNVKTEIN
jgi:hypothetical protein